MAFRKAGQTPLYRHYSKSEEGVSSEALRQAWGDFVDEVGRRKGDWDWYATLTFRDRTPEEQARGWTKAGWKYTENACNAFLTHLTFETMAKPIWWFRAREYQRWRGVPHWHLLIGGVAEVRRDEMWQWWFNKYGINRILPYEREKGARFYLCKYVTKELGDIRFSENLTKV